jgi:hypothetical protein
MNRLTNLASFKLRIDKKTFELLTHYLELYKRHGCSRIVHLREKDGEFVYWLRNSVCFYTVRVNFRNNTVELRKVYFSLDLEKDVSRRQAIGAADKRATYLLMLQRMVSSAQRRKKG